MHPSRVHLTEAKSEIFLSHRSVNRIWVLNLHDALHQPNPYQVVLAGGDELIRVLENCFQQIQAGGLVWSSQTVDSINARGYPQLRGGLQKGPEKAPTLHAPV